jgi:DtxR family Mn-dependent transcriptional regulator
LTWDEVHEEAEHLEHAISDRLIDRIDEFLGFPARDPHGDPIPHADGSERTAPGDPLSELGRGARFRLVRVLDQSPEFLRYLAEGGLELGAAAVVVNLQPSAGIIQIRANGRTISLSCEMARRLLIEKTA